MKDNELKKLSGSRHANHSAPELPLEVPNCPIDLSPEEVLIFERTVQCMVKMKIITAADLDLLTDYATLRHFLNLMIQQVKEGGLLVEKVLDRGVKAQRVHPLLPEILRLLPFVNGLRRELGLSPETRQKRVAIGDVNSVDQLDSFIDNL